MILGNPRDPGITNDLYNQGYSIFYKAWVFKRVNGTMGILKLVSNGESIAPLDFDGPLVTVFIVYGVWILICWVVLVSEGIKFGLKNIKSLYLRVLYETNRSKKLAEIFGNQLFKSLLVFMAYSLLRDHLLFAPRAMFRKGPNQ